MLLQREYERLGADVVVLIHSTLLSDSAEEFVNDKL